MNTGQKWSKYGSKMSKKHPKISQKNISKKLQNFFGQRIL